MWKKGVFVIALLVSWFSIASPALAADSTPLPEFNPVCWKQKDCISMRAKLQGTVLDSLTPAEKDAVGSGWIQAAPCTGDWGKCLPANVTVTKIGIGGKTRFINIGDYILTVYNYILGIVGILAAAMIVIAGVQWVTSGGNAESISTAKHRITNALIGMFLAYSSFFILNTINPALTSLRLPQVYMLRPNDITPKYCSAAQVGTKFAQAADSTHQSDALADAKALQFNLAFAKSAPVSTPPTPSPSTPNQSSPDQNESTNPANTPNASTQPAAPTVAADSYDDKSFACGARFYMAGGGSLACYGDYCDPGSICTTVGSSDPKNPYQCVPGIMAGQIGGDVQFETGHVVFDGDLNLFAFCKDGSSRKVAGQTVNNSVKPFTYIFNASYDDAIGKCGGEANTAGFYLAGDVNDTTGGPGGKWNIDFLGLTAFGLDDWHVIGQEDTNSHICDVNLAKVGNAITNEFIPCTTQRNFGGCTLSFMELSTPKSDTPSKLTLNSLASNATFLKHLISPAELKSGYQCDIGVNRGEFPAMDAGDPIGRPVDSTGAPIDPGGP